MENRFGIKDGVIIVLLIVSVIMVALAMVQFDRQWKDVKSVQGKQDELIQSQTSQEKKFSELSRQQKEMIQSQILQEKKFRALGKEIEALEELIRTRSIVASNGGSSNGEPNNGEPKQQDSTTPQKKPDFFGIPGDAKWIGEGKDYFSRVSSIQKKENYSTGDHYVQSLSSKVGNLNPFTSTDSSASLVQSYVLESLARRDPETLEWKPLIAKSWFISEDGMTITFKMKDDVNFSDGTPLTAHDVAFSYALMMNEKINSPHLRGYFKTIGSVEALDDYTVRFVFVEPYFEAFELAASMDILPKHFYSKFTPEQFNKGDNLLMGSGPYRLESPDGWQSGQAVILYRNQRYWGPPAPFDEIQFRIVTNPSARLVEFRNQTVDAFFANPKQYEQIKDDEQIVRQSNTYQYLSGTAGYRYIGWNQKKQDGSPSRFADKRVRQALTYLTPRERIKDEVQLGYARVSVGPFHPNSKQNKPGITPRKYNFDKAMELLKQAGYTYDSRRRILIGQDKKPFSFELMYPSNSPIYDEMVTMIANAYAKAGIKLVKKPIEWSIFVQKLNSREFEAVTLGWTGGVETDIHQMFHSEKIEEGHNFIGYSNPKLDTLIDQARRTVNEEDRMKLWRQAHEILYEDQPYTFLLVGDTLAFFDKRIQNMEKLKLGLNPYIEWFVPKGQQRWTQ